MKDKITLKEIEKIKFEAENMICEIIKTVEKQTCCQCEDISMYLDLEEDRNIDTLEIDLNLRITNRLDNR